MRQKILLLSFLMVLLRSSPAQAIPLSLALTIDDKTKGRAVLSGVVAESFAAFPPNTPETFDIPKTGTNWYVEATIFRYLFDNPRGKGIDYNVAVRARHITDPAPHTGETSPGLFLGGGLEVHHGSVAGNFPFGDLGPQDRKHQLIHPGSVDHYDVLSSHLDDLNDDKRGFLTADGQISDRIDLAHTPEPLSAVLFGSGLLGLLGSRRKKSIEGIIDVVCNSLCYDAL